MVREEKMFQEIPGSYREARLITKLVFRFISGAYNKCYLQP